MAVLRDPGGAAISLTPDDRSKLPSGWSVIYLRDRPGATRAARPSFAGGSAVRALSRRTDPSIVKGWRVREWNAGHRGRMRKERAGMSLRSSCSARWQATSFSAGRFAPTSWHSGGPDRTGGFGFESG